MRSDFEMLIEILTIFVGFLSFFTCRAYYQSKPHLHLPSGRRQKSSSKNPSDSRFRHFTHSHKSTCWSRVQPRQIQVVAGS